MKNVSAASDEQELSENVAEQHPPRYVPARLPDFEISRLKELTNLDILDTGNEERFDRYTQLAADIFDIPVAILTLIDKDYQWFKSCYGAPMAGTPRDLAFCGYTILENEILVIENMQDDPRFIYHPLVANEPYVRFYAGVLLKGPNNYPVGTLCLIDFKARPFSEKDQKRLIHMGKMVEHEVHYKYHLNQMRKNVENIIYYDLITDLPSRRLFKDRLDHSIQDKRDKDEPLKEIVVLCLEFDRLEGIKITLGKNAVDLALKEISYRLKKLLGPEFSIARSGEKSFLVCADLRSAQTFEKTLQQVTEAIKSIFNNPIKIDDRNELSVAVKIGVAIYGRDDFDTNKLIEKAGIAARMAGENANIVQLYGSCPIERVSELFHMENKLSKAIKNCELHLIYQPIIDSRTGLICGAEALCRWNDEELRHIPPAAFIPIAENSGLIIPLGEWILRQAIKTINQWHKKNAIDFPISVNISGEQLVLNNFFDILSESLTAEELDPTLLTLEVTEASLIHNMEEAINNMRKANALGVNFSLDDFGTGYSSLTYLQKLPIKYLKIDKSFVDNLTSNVNDAALVQGIVALARNLNLTVVAEGVETQDQLTFLKAYQCQRVQGYLFSPPLSSDDFLALVQKTNNL